MGHQCKAMEQRDLLYCLFMFKVDKNWKQNKALFYECLHLIAKESIQNLKRTVADIRKNFMNW